MQIDLSLLPDLELVLEGDMSTSDWFKHISDRAKYYDQVISDCLHTRELFKLSFSEIAKLSKIERDALIQRRKYKYVASRLSDSKFKVTIGNLVANLKYYTKFQKAINELEWTSRTDALNDIIKNKEVK